MQAERLPLPLSSTSVFSLPLFPFDSQPASLRASLMLADGRAKTSKPQKGGVGVRIFGPERTADQWAARAGLYAREGGIKGRPSFFMPVRPKVRPLERDGNLRGLLQTPPVGSRGKATIKWCRPCKEAACSRAAEQAWRRQKGGRRGGAALFLA